MLFFLNKAEPDGQIRRDEWIALGRAKIPTFNDAAADLPPKAHLSDYCRMGFDLVAFSGGKGLLGPQCSGLLLGRKDLVDAARISGESGWANWSRHEGWERGDHRFDRRVGTLPQGRS